MEEFLLYIVGFVGVGVLFGLVLNPYIWDTFYKAWFIDRLKKIEKDLED